jgi:hypothetical protein
MKQLRVAVRQVERELHQLGLWIPGMEGTQVYLTPFHNWYGWTSLRDRDIFVPRISTFRWFNASAWSLADILRHEYGHVLALNSAKLLKTWPRDDDRVSEYAHTNEAEDFAETVKFFLKHKGQLPRRWRARPGIARRWERLNRAACRRRGNETV